MEKLAQKLINVMKACHYVEKDKANAFHKYRYASAEAILSKVNAALVENGIATFANTEILSSEALLSAKGAPEKFVTARVTITLVDTETGESRDISGLGSGQDLGDKAIAKAQTMATKYAWITSLNIATGDDPEEDEELDRRLNAQQAVRKPPVAVVPKQIATEPSATESLLKQIESARSQTELTHIIEEARASHRLAEVGPALWIKRAQLCKNAKQVKELRTQMERAHLTAEAQAQILGQVALTLMVPTQQAA